MECDSLEEAPKERVQAPKAHIPSLMLGTYDKRRVVEEPDELKSSRPVLKPSGGGDPVA